MIPREGKIYKAYSSDRYLYVMYANNGKAEYMVLQKIFDAWRTFGPYNDTYDNLAKVFNLECPVELREVI